MVSLNDFVVKKSILNFLNEEYEKELSDSNKESLEVAIQCLSSIWSMECNEPAVPDLRQIFSGQNFTSKITEEERANAENCKDEGNSLMKSEKYDEAISRYTHAITIDPNNAVYHCNRAAAYSKVDDHQAALNDSIRALEIDPQYAKAYGRKGLALSSLNRCDEAVVAYQRAVELEPTNASYCDNLAKSQQYARENPERGPMGGGGAFAAPTGPAGGIPGLGDMSNLGAVFNNPDFMQMATRMMSDGNVRDALSGFISNQSPGAPAPDSSNSPNIQSLFTAGQQMAEALQQSNPDLVNQLRQQMGDSAQRQNPDAPGDNNSS